MLVNQLANVVQF